MQYHSDYKGYRIWTTNVWRGGIRCDKYHAGKMMPNAEIICDTIHATQLMIDLAKRRQESNLRVG